MFFVEALSTYTCTRDHYLISRWVAFKKANKIWHRFRREVVKILSLQQCEFDNLSKSYKWWQILDLQFNQLKFLCSPDGKNNKRWSAYFFTSDQRRRRWYRKDKTFLCISKAIGRQARGQYRREKISGVYKSSSNMVSCAYSTRYSLCSIKHYWSTRGHGKLCLSW